MASRLNSLDERPKEEFPQDQINAIFEKLGLDGGIKLGPDATNTSSMVSPGCSRQKRRPKAKLLWFAASTPNPFCQIAALRKFSAPTPSDSKQGEQSDLLAFLIGRT